MISPNPKNEKKRPGVLGFSEVCCFGVFFLYFLVCFCIFWCFFGIFWCVFVFWCVLFFVFPLCVFFLCFCGFCFEWWSFCLMSFVCFVWFLCFQFVCVCCKRFLKMVLRCLAFYHIIFPIVFLCVIAKTMPLPKKGKTPMFQQCICHLFGF